METGSVRRAVTLTATQGLSVGPESTPCGGLSVSAGRSQQKITGAWPGPKADCMQGPSPNLASSPGEPRLLTPIEEPRNLPAYCEELGQYARAAARELALASGALKNHWLHLVAEALETRCGEILEANSYDLASA